MGKITEVAIVLPCFSLEDLALDRPAEEANQILAGWAGAFHPWLVHQAADLPTWHSADSPPDPEGRVIFLPDCNLPRLPEGWLEKARERSVLLVEGAATCEDADAAVLTHFPAAKVDKELRADFAALGLCFFWVELLTRQLRYMSNLDEVAFENHVLAAAQAAVENKRDDFSTQLQTAFELLQEARDYFYPVDLHLLDFAIYVPQLAPKELCEWLQDVGSGTLITSGQTIETLAQKAPEVLQQLRHAVKSGKVTLVGGEWREGAILLLPPQIFAEQVKRGLAAYAKYLDVRPVAFGRRRFGLSPMLPTLLKLLGFDWTLHFALDEGRFPTGNQSRIRWQGLGQTTIDALARIPFDAGRPECFMRLPERLGEAMDLDHAATAAFAHWPTQVCPWYGYLQRAVRFGTVLGQFRTLGEYFEYTQHTAQTVSYAASKYRSRYLKQAVAQQQPDPISRWIRFYKAWAIVEQFAMLGTLHGLLEKRLPQDFLAVLNDAIGALAGNPDGLLEAFDTDAIWQRCNLSQEAQADRQDNQDKTGETASAVRAFTRVLEQFHQLLARLGEKLCQPTADKTNDKGNNIGWLVLNPSPFVVEHHVEVDQSVSPLDSELVRSDGVVGKSRHMMLRLPPAGFVALSPKEAETGQTATSQPTATSLWSRVQRALFRSTRSRSQPLVIEENALRNEFFQVEISPTTGAIQAIRDYERGHNRLSQQIAFRTLAANTTWSDSEKQYTIMAADKIRVETNGPACGTIVSQGRLMLRSGQPAAKFIQKTTVRRGSRLIELEIQLEPVVLPEGNPMHNYYAVRFAWDDATAEVFRHLGWCLVAQDDGLFESPLLVDVRAQHERLTFLYGGLPYHRYYDLRKLDSLLVVAGEKARKWRVGILIDEQHVVPHALSFLTQPQLVPCNVRPEKKSGWLLNISPADVIALAFTPVTMDEKFVGVRFHLAETKGKQTTAKVRFCRKPRAAWKTNLLNQRQEELSVLEDTIEIDLQPYQYQPVEVEFS